VTKSRRLDKCNQGSKHFKGLNGNNLCYESVRFYIVRCRKPPNFNDCNDLNDINRDVLDAITV
jgi:hypothetical protein